MEMRSKPATLLHWLQLSFAYITILYINISQILLYVLYIIIHTGHKTTVGVHTHVTKKELNAIILHSTLLLYSPKVISWSKM